MVHLKHLKYRDAPPNALRAFGHRGRFIYFLEFGDLAFKIRGDIHELFFIHRLDAVFDRYGFAAPLAELGYQTLSCGKYKRRRDKKGVDAHIDQTRYDAYGAI